MSTVKPLPNALLGRLRDMLSPVDYEATIQAFSQDRTCSFRVNTLKSSPEEVEAILSTMGISFARVPFIPLAYTIDRSNEYTLKWSDLFRSGKIYVQWLASQLPALFLDLTDSMRVFDVTAAPGSKTTQISALIHDTGTIVACEKHQIRYDKLVHNIRLQGATNIESLKMDAIKFAQDSDPEVFDAILLDAPCSAEGRIRTDDERTFGFWSRNNTLRNAEIQKELLRATIPLLKKWGALVYSTCTLALEENEEVIDMILKEFDDLQLEPISLDSEWARPGLTRFRDTLYGGELKNTVRLIPSSITEGFFIAKLRKI